MGAKYLPSIKDLKAERRFHQQQHTQSKFIKPAAKPSPPRTSSPKSPPTKRP
jgi:hypothetical protein